MTGGVEDVTRVLAEHRWVRSSAESVDGGRYGTCQKCGGYGTRIEHERHLAELIASLSDGRLAEAEAAHVVHVTAAPVAEDVVWCEACEEWVTAGEPEHAALSGGEAGS